MKHVTYVRQVYQYLMSNAFFVGDVTDSVLIGRDLGIKSNQASAAFIHLEKKGVIKAVGKNGRTVRWRLEAKKPLSFRQKELKDDIVRNRPPGAKQNRRDLPLYTPNEVRASFSASQPEIKVALHTNSKPAPSICDKLLELAIQVEELQKDVLSRVPTRFLVAELRRRREHVRAA